MLICPANNDTNSNDNDNDDTDNINETNWFVMTACKRWNHKL